MTIRPLAVRSDLPLVQRFYQDAPDFWLLAEGHCDPQARAAEFFTDCPPGCDPAKSARLGLFLDQRLSGMAELSFGFPQPGDAYLGLMLLGPWAQGRGHGVRFLAHIEEIAREAAAPRLYLAVLDSNPRARLFWERQGFLATGDHRVTDRDVCVRRMMRVI